MPPVRGPPTVEIMSPSDEGQPWPPLTLGIEEEFHLVDLATRQLAPRSDEVLTDLRADFFSTELHQSIIETNTPVATTLADLRTGVGDLRADLVAACERRGLGIAAAGTMPLAAPALAVTDNARYKQMLADYQLLVREQLICGLQVHVGVPDPDTAVRVMQRVAPWTPLLLAISASSPFWHTGEDTGYASVRSLVWQRWPTSGTSGPLRDAGEYRAMVEDLVATGVISDPGMIYFDVRPSSHLPTVELRVCDACPSLDAVLLVAGLFRALVGRAIAADRRRAPLPVPRDPVHRAAMWRAARSGLEGDLVDPLTSRPVLAADLLRRTVDDLRAELDRNGDTAEVHGLAQVVLAQGSPAARQRRAFARAGRIEDVVDQIIVETAAGAAAAIGPGPGPLPMLHHYVSPAFDEAFTASGEPRESHAALLDAVCESGVAGLRERQERFGAEKAAAGVTFRAAGQEEADVFPVDVLPRVVTDWDELKAGMEQRSRALDAFLQDVYSEAQVVADGVLPAWVLARSPGMRATGTAAPSGRTRLHVTGFDLVRDADGHWRVLEDNARVPSGIGFALWNRRLTDAASADLQHPHGLLDVAAAPGLLRAALDEAGPPNALDSPAVVLLSGGSDDSAWFEHQLLADLMDVPLVEAADLVVIDDVLHRVVDGARHRVDVAYLRMDEDVLAASAGADGRRLGPAAVAAVRAGNLTLANALGNGVADDKAVYAYGRKMIEYYLGEAPLLDDVPTYLLGDPDQLDQVLPRLHELVVKPVDGYGGTGVVIGPDSSERELHDLRALVKQEPARWIAQEMVELSTHPTFDGTALSPRRIDLRGFVLLGRHAVAAPAALTRVAPAGSMIVNSSRGGGSKDTWLVSASERP